MARTMRIDNTDIYRTVVEMAPPGRNVLTYVYGPHDSKSSNKDYTENKYWEDEPRRITKQKLVHSYLGGGKLIWSTYNVTYKNGGEGVNWGA